MTDPALVLAQAAASVLVAPLAVGVTKRVKARCQRRRGPPLLQGYYDLAKWMRKGRVVSVHASPLLEAAPWLVLGATTAAAALVPGAAAVGGPGDLLAVAGLLGLGRFLLATGGLEAGSAFGGMSSSRESALSALVEPAFVLALAAPALAALSLRPEAVAAATGAGPTALAGAMLLSVAALLVVSIAETGRLPVDNPDTHLELTMIHEGMLLETSGPPLAAAHLAASVKQVLLLSLVAALFLPWGIAPGGADGAVWARGGAAWAAKVFALSALLGLVESASVKVRLFRVPEFLGGAFLLGLAGAFLA